MDSIELLSDSQSVDPDTEKMINKFSNIIMTSCEKETPLAKSLNEQQYELQSNRLTTCTKSQESNDQLIVLKSNLNHLLNLTNKAIKKHKL